MSEESKGRTLARLRLLLIAVLLLGLAGTAIELLLMGHVEDPWQVVPLVTLGAAMVASIGIAARGAAVTRPLARLFRSAMLLLIVSGATGMVLHYRANMEFKLELDPSLSGLTLFRSVIQAKAPPSLAPGNMALLGLLGLACAYRVESEPLDSRRERNV